MSGADSSSVDQMVLKTAILSFLLLRNHRERTISVGIGRLFGAVILALGYELLIAFMAPDEVQAEAAES